MKLFALFTSGGLKKLKKTFEPTRKGVFKHKELTEKLIQLEALIEAGKVFASSKNLNQIFELVKDILPRMAKCQAFIIQFKPN